MAEYTMRTAVRVAIGRELDGYKTNGFPIYEVINRIEQLIRTDIEIVDDAPAPDNVEYSRPIGYHGDRER